MTEDASGTEQAHDTRHAGSNHPRPRRWAAFVAGAALVLVAVAWHGLRHQILPAEWRTGAVGVALWALAWACLGGGTWLVAVGISRR